MHTHYNKLESDFNFYLKYHNKFWNKIVHLICIPGLCFSIFVLLNNIDLSYNFLNTKTEIDCIFSIKSSLILYSFYIIYYLYLSPVIGFFCMLFYLIILILSNLFFCTVNNSYIWALIIHISSWIFQILSHKFIEGNSPAFKEGLIQSFLTAPLFIVVEILEFITNYKWIKRINIQENLLNT